MLNWFGDYRSLRFLCGYFGGRTFCFRGGEIVNILNEKQHLMFEKEISKKEYEDRKKDFLDTYYDLREKVDNSFLGKLSIKQHKNLHWLAYSLICLKSKFSGFSYEILKSKPEKSDKPIIFAVTHIGKFDIEILNWAIKWHSYILTGDFERLQGTVDGTFCDLNGAVYFNERVKEDRISASERMIKVLKSGTNLMFFPEGAWNLSPNQPMNPCYWGIIDVAKKGNAVILPIAIEQYGKHFKIAFGDYLKVFNYEDKSIAINTLRDEMATLKWLIWETEFTSRSDISESYWKKYVAERLAEWSGFTEEYINGLVFKPKGITEPTEAYAHLETLSSNPYNAFLFNKRLH